MAGSDERLPPAGANQLLQDVSLLRCTACGLPMLEYPAGVTRPAWRPHSGCGGNFRLVTDYLTRAILFRMLSRQMFGKA